MAEDNVNESQKKKEFDWTFLKGFAAGVIFSHINKTLVLGFIIGTVSGAFIEQNFQNIPNIKQEAQGLIKKLKESTKK